MPIFNKLKNLSDSFFDGLKTGAIDKMLAQARKARLEREAIEKMERIARDAKELEDILSKIPVAKKEDEPVPPIINRMREIDKLAKELEEDMKYYDPSDSK